MVKIIINEEEPFSKSYIHFQKLSVKKRRITYMKRYFLAKSKKRKLKTIQNQRFQKIKAINFFNAMARKKDALMKKQEQNRTNKGQTTPSVPEETKVEASK